MNQAGQRSLEALASPSNLAMATLVGFLFVGQSTDWKMLRGRPSKSASSVAPLSPEHTAHATRTYSRLRSGAAPVYLKVDRQSEFVDRRTPLLEGKSRQELD
jgi:hypothetical protein